MSLTSTLASSSFYQTSKNEKRLWQMPSTLHMTCSFLILVCYELCSPCYHFGNLFNLFIRGTFSLSNLISFLTMVIPWERRNMWHGMFIKDLSKTVFILSSCWTGHFARFRLLDENYFSLEFWRHHSLFFFFLDSSVTNWRRRWHPTPVLSNGKSQGWRSLVGSSPWGH